MRAWMCVLWLVVGVCCFAGQGRLDLEVLDDQIELSGSSGEDSEVSYSLVLKSEGVFQSYLGKGYSVAANGDNSLLIAQSRPATKDYRMVSVVRPTGSKLILDLEFSNTVHALLANAGVKGLGDTRGLVCRKIEDNTAYFVWRDYASKIGQYEFALNWDLPGGWRYVTGSWKGSD